MGQSSGQSSGQSTPGRRLLPQCPVLPGSGLLLPQNDPRVHENLVNIMDRRLSNVQLMRTSRSNSAHSQASHSSSPSMPGDHTISNSQRSSWTAPLQPNNNVNTYSNYFLNNSHHNNQYNNNNNSSSVRQNNNINNSHTYGYYPQAHPQPQSGFNKRRRTTFWETLTGLVCSLGALATRAAKMAARKAEPL